MQATTINTEEIQKEPRNGKNALTTWNAHKIISTVQKQKHKSETQNKNKLNSNVEVVTKTPPTSVLSEASRRLRHSKILWPPKEQRTPRANRGAHLRRGETDARREGGREQRKVLRRFAVARKVSEVFK